MKGHVISALVFTIGLALLTWALVAWTGQTYGPADYVVGSGVAYFLGQRRGSRDAAVKP